jgi:hypothetical protein
MDLSNALVTAIERLDAGQLPMSDGLAIGWPDLGRRWIVLWAVELDRDVRLTGESVAAAPEIGSGPEGVAHLEVALWPLTAGREKLHALIALVFGVDALRVSKNKKRIQRFEPDRHVNRTRLNELAGDHVAATDLLALDEALARHRFLRLRHQLTHSLAPILEWRSLMWFEVAEVKRGGVIDYGARYSSVVRLHRLTGGRPSLPTRATVTRVPSRANDAERPRQVRRPKTTSKTHRVCSASEAAKPHEQSDCEAIGVDRRHSRSGLSRRRSQVRILPFRRSPCKPP